MTTPPLPFQIISLLLLAGWLLWQRARRGRRARRARRARRRSHPAYPVPQISQVADAAKEEARLLLLPLGRGNIAGAQSADSAAALELTRQPRDLGPTPACHLLSGDGTLWLATRQGHTAACFSGPDAATYAAGVRNHLSEEPAATIAPCGLFGDEYLLFAEPGAWRSLDRPAAAASPALLPFLLTTSTEPVLGAELYEAASLLSEKTARPLLGWLSLILALIILASVILQSL